MVYLLTNNTLIKILELETVKPEKKIEVVTEILLESNNLSNQEKKNNDTIETIGKITKGLANYFAQKALTKIQTGFDELFSNKSEKTSENTTKKVPEEKNKEEISEEETTDKSEKVSEDSSLSEKNKHFIIQYLGGKISYDDQTSEKLEIKNKHFIGKYLGGKISYDDQTNEKPEIKNKLFKKQDEVINKKSKKDIINERLKHLEDEMDQAEKYFVYMTINISNVADENDERITTLEKILVKETTTLQELKDEIKNRGYIVQDKNYKIFTKSLTQRKIIHIKDDNKRKLPEGMPLHFSVKKLGLVKNADFEIFNL